MTLKEARRRLRLLLKASHGMLYRHRRDGQSETFRTFANAVRAAEGRPPLFTEDRSR